MCSESQCSPSMSSADLAHAAPQIQVPLLSHSCYPSSKLLCPRKPPCLSRSQPSYSLLPKSLSLLFCLLHMFSQSTACYVARHLSPDVQPQDIFERESHMQRNKTNRKFRSSCLVLCIKDILRMLTNKASSGYLGVKSRTVGTPSYTGGIGLRNQSASQ